MWRWLGWSGVALAAVVAGVCLFVGSRFAPFVLDDLALDHAVRAAALDWRDFGEQRARERLQYELDHREVGLQVSDSDCELRESEVERGVHCAWSTEVDLLVARVPVAFGSDAIVASDGDLR